MAMPLRESKAQIFRRHSLLLKNQKYLLIVGAILSVIQAFIVAPLKAEAASIYGDAFVGDWTNTEDNCDEDVPYGIEVIHVYRDNVSWWEIDCHIETAIQDDKNMRSSVRCIKGGGATDAGLLQIQLLGGGKMAFSTRGTSFLANSTRVYSRCFDSKNSSQRWFHNSSVVTVDTRGDTVEIRYDIPRAGMRMVGAKKGDLLFLGKKDGNSVEGTAFIFNKACGPHPYKAKGIMDQNIGIIRLFGGAPILSNKCNVTKSKKDILEFRKIDK